MSPEQHAFMSILADSKEHSFFEIIKLGACLLKKSERSVERFFFQRILENGWAYRHWKSWSPRLDFFQLTIKGDDAFRGEQMRRALIGLKGKAAQDALRHFKYYNRDKSVDLSEKRITERQIRESGFKPEFGE